MGGQEGWIGNYVFSNEGTCVIQTSSPTPLYPSFLYTPMNDYSGSLTITFIAKALPTYWYVVNDEGEEVRQRFTGSSIDVAISNASNRRMEIVGGVAYELASVRLYEEQGWCKVKIEVDNLSAYNDSFISFSTSEIVEIDNIEVTSSVDNFIAAPVIESVTDVTQTSFTVNFQPVRKAYNYYLYLYTLKGYDEETGEPIFLPMFDPDTMAMLSEFDISLEEYVEMMGGMNSPYTFYGDIDQGKPTTFTYTELDPETQYYYAVRAHYMYQFSDYDIIPMNQIAAPIVGEATDITTDSFTANWSQIMKADTYEVNLYGVNNVSEDTDNFIIFEENFDKVGNHTEATDIYYPDVVSPESGLTMDDLTSTPGWETEIEHALLVNGMLGLDDYNYWLYTPDLYVAGDDKIVVSLRAQFTNDDPTFYIKFAGKLYEVPVSGDVFESEFELPTNGLDISKLQITGPDYDIIFIDYIKISQSLKKGDLTYTYMGKEVTEDTSAFFTGLDANRFDFYGYAVQAIKGEGSTAIYSQPSERMIVDIKNGESFTGVTAIDIISNGEVKEVERYGIDGRKLNAPSKGLNIIRMSDGSIRKVFVK